LRTHGYYSIKLSINDEKSVRTIGTSDYGFDLLKILDLIGWDFNRHRTSAIFYLRLSNDISITGAIWL
jgi:hypothetical protein